MRSDSTWSVRARLNRENIECPALAWPWLVMQVGNVRSEVESGGVLR